MKNKDGLYHKDVYMPKLALSDKNIEIAYTYHAIEASKTDERGIIDLPATVNPAMGETIEIEIKNDKLVKIVLRTKYSLKYDLTLVILTDCLKVKTVWLNNVNDKHYTLDKSRYVQRPNR